MTRQKMFNFPFFTKKKREKERKEKRENLIKISLSPCIHPPFVVRFLSSYFFLSSFLSFCLEEHQGRRTHRWQWRLTNSISTFAPYFVRRGNRPTPPFLCSLCSSYLFAANKYFCFPSLGKYLRMEGREGRGAPAQRATYVEILSRNLLSLPPPPPPRFFETLCRVYAPDQSDPPSTLCKSRRNRDHPTMNPDFFVRFFLDPDWFNAERC